AVGVAGATAGSVSLGKLFLFFLKVGSVLYGSGYVLIAFLEGGLVADRGWLTQAQLLDAIALGQFTPGPVLSTATFIGYVLEGVPGAAVATLGIFLPSFVFVLLLNPLIPRLRRSVWMSAFLDAVNVAALALMVAVTIELGAAVLTSAPAWIIALGAALLVVRFRTNAVWLVLGGALAGRVLWAWSAGPHRGTGIRRTLGVIHRHRRARLSRSPPGSRRSAGRAAPARRSGGSTCRPDPGGRARNCPLPRRTAHGPPAPPHGRARAPQRRTGHPRGRKSGV